MTGRTHHVLHVIKGLGLGGAESLLEHYQRYSDPDSFRLSFAYYLAHKDALAPRLGELGAEVHLIRSRGSAGMLLAVGRTARLIREQRVDLIHAHLPLSGSVARLAGRRAGVPLVYTEHSQHERVHPLTRFANRRTWRLQNRVIAVSRAVEASIRRSVGSSVPVTVIPNAVAVDELRPDPRRAASFRAELGIPSGAPLVGQVAVFRPEKRLDRWLEAAAAIAARRPEARFVLVGDGPERAALEARARDLGLGGVVDFTGLVEDVRPALAAIDLLMISSRFEGLPLTLLEAMAMGTAVVATPAGGVPEAVSHGETGLLARNGTAVELAELAESLLADAPKREAFGSTAAARAAERFSASEMQRRLESVYREILGR